MTLTLKQMSNDDDADGAADGMETGGRMLKTIHYNFITIQGKKEYRAMRCEIRNRPTLKRDFQSPEQRVAAELIFNLIDTDRDCGRERDRGLPRFQMLEAIGFQICGE